MNYKVAYLKRKVTEDVLTNILPSVIRNYTGPQQVVCGVRTGRS